MTLDEDLKAQLLAGTATITTPVGLVGSDYSIAMVYFKPTPVVVEPPVEEPPPVVVDPPPLPVVVNLIEGSEAGSTSKSLTIPFVAGKTYTVSLDVVGSAVGRFELFSRTAKGKTSVAKQSGPGKLNYVIAPKAADIGLFFDVKSSLHGITRCSSRRRNRGASRGRSASACRGGSSASRRAASGRDASSCQRQGVDRAESLKR